MHSLLLASVLLTASRTNPESCPDLRSAFSEYRAAVLQSTDVGRHFSRRYLEAQIDDLLVDGNEAALLHNVKATRKQMLIRSVARSDYQLTVSCSASNGSVSLTFPTGTTRLLRLGYILDGGAWRIDKLEIMFGGQAQMAPNNSFKPKPLRGSA